MNLTVIAAGAWGTALAITFSARHRVTLWTREEDVTQSMQVERENRHFFPGYRFPDALQIGTVFDSSVADADLLILATPLIGFRSTLRRRYGLPKFRGIPWGRRVHDRHSGRA